MSAPDSTQILQENATLRRELAEVRQQIAMLEKLAREDGLTGLLNRRSFDLELARAVSLQARYGTEAVLVLADLDGFKPLNDRLGHPAGDVMLRHVAGLLQASIRASDIAARVGGDEFALILWQISPELAAAKIAELEGRLAGSPLTIAGETLVAKASFGFAALMVGQSAEATYAVADAALYVRKSERNPLRR
ncbi:MAG: GGDEF domain-containing protein [Bosea sp. (in: a-proteobacteria)]